MLLTNDAYITGSHLNHMTFAVPIFHGDEMVGFSACMAHWLDIGGALDGMTKDIFAEGLQMPIVKDVPTRRAKRGHSCDHSHERALSRTAPMGDLNAQVAAIRMGARCFSRAGRRHGRRDVLERYRGNHEPHRTVAASR